MQRHKWKLVAALAAGVLVLLAVGAFVLRPRPSRATLENRGLLREGMTRAEVQAVLGGPPGDYRTGPTRAAPMPPMRFFPEKWPPRGQWEWQPRIPKDWDIPPERSTDRWDGDSVTITVGFDDEGRAVCGRYVTASKVGQSSFDAFLWRLKRQWERWVP